MVDGSFLSRDLCKGMVGPGWSRLIDKLFDRIETTGRPVVVIDIKEKFGLLRISVYGCFWGDLDFIDELEQESGTICEDCGDPGKIRDELSWLRTLCRVCLKKSQLVSAHRAGR